MDQENTPQPIQAVMSEYDIISFGSPNAFNLSSSNYSTTCGTGANFSTGPCGVYTNSNGTTQTDVNSICSTLCYQNSACVVPSNNPTTVFTQTWVIAGFKVTPNQYTVTCGSILINGN
jgi:hypothetical protein